MGPLSSQVDLIQVVAIVGVFIVCIRLARHIGPAIARRIGGEADSGHRSDALQADVEELRVRLADLEHDRDRLAELEERLDFAERMLSKPAETRRMEA